MKEIYVTKPYLPTQEKYQEYLSEIWKTGILTNNGPLKEKLTRKLTKLIKNDNINLFCNGHQSLEILLRSLDMKQNGEIITTPFTFVSTTHAIINCGFKPVFCDIKTDNYTIDEDKIESLITDKTVAILGVHVYGFPCNVKRIQKIADKYNLKVIYDAAHAFGVNYAGQSILNYGDASIVSFHATKLFNTIEGGMTVTNDVNVYNKQQIIQNFGITGYDTVDYIGTNAKMNEFQAAMGLATIDDLDKIISARKKIVDIYKDELSNVKGILTADYDIANISSNYAYFPIIIVPEEYGLTRDDTKFLLESNGIYPRKYFYPLTSDLNCYKENYAYFGEYNLENARRISNNVLTLPLYYDLNIEDVKRICSILRRKK